MAEGKSTRTAKKEGEPAKDAPKKDAPKKAAPKKGSEKAYSGFSDAERKAMQERAKELAAEASQGKLKGKAKQEKDVLDKIAEMPEPDRSMAERIHALVQENAPQLSPKTMYGMPAYANKEGKVVCFFQAASKWDTRYAALAFEDRAKLDEGTMWPTSFAIKELSPANEKKLAELIRKAVS